MAERDAIVAFAGELLQVDRFQDYGPVGLQVEGTSEVEKIVCSVSASLELFELAAERGAQMVLVHHGLFWNNEQLACKGDDRVTLGHAQILWLSA